MRRRSAIYHNVISGTLSHINPSNIAVYPDDATVSTNKAEEMETICVRYFDVLYELLRKDTKFQGTDQHTTVFHTPKTAIITVLVLRNYDVRYYTSVYTDASTN